MVEFYVVPFFDRALPIVLVEPPSVCRRGGPARAGWRAYTAYALKATRGEVPRTADPEGHAPSDLSAADRESWSYGWAVHQAALVDEILSAAYGSR